MDYRGKKIIMTKITMAEKHKWLGSSVGGDNMTTSQAWEHTGQFPPLGNRLCPTAKLVFHVGIAFVKCERVNNSISPECQFMEPQMLGKQLVTWKLSAQRKE